MDLYLTQSQSNRGKTMDETPHAQADRRHQSRRRARRALVTSSVALATITGGLALQALPANAAWYSANPSACPVSPGVLNGVSAAMRSCP